ncbi:hypothetical protein [Kangiella spongicola]|uniref:Uncharacterized protein n=1 Tax=Kangiella spongicola TaxID=796379 RepID=A0A318CZZ1_9GAMM|nr:hypothetical protein [Kangiella spongicola]PXF62552.1 hypothetical protein DL796_09430 [Kangiella spongicola]
MANNDTYKVGRALFVAPLIPSLLIVMLSLLFSEEYDVAMLTVLLVMTVISYMVTFIIGLPTFALLNKLYHLNIITLSVSGAILGAVSLAVIDIFLNLYNEASLPLLFGAVIGFITSFIFGLVAGVKVLNNHSRRY